jgi:hypothetical protein
VTGKQGKFIKRQARRLLAVGKAKEENEDVRVINGRKIGGSMT